MNSTWWDEIAAFLARPILPLGGGGLSLGVLLKLTGLLALLVVVTNWLQSWLVKRLLIRTKLDPSARQAVGSVFHYLALLIGLLLILQTVGIDLTALSVVAGGLGIGLGFGLQNVANNLVSGLVVLLERPVKIGDRIEVAGTEGQVVEIRARSTTVLTNDNIAIIIPNSRFITEEVVNWSYADSKVRFRIPVTVGYESDVRLVERLLMEVAAGNHNVLAEPAPVVRFIAFGESALQFELRAWSNTLVQRKGKLISDLNFAILEAFRANGIAIPYPQRDVHVKSLSMGGASGIETGA
ncbi:MAG: mechanosensitive ion channel [Bryobacterales bacterium]|nr:mechanosensitive ion channel [Bryobacterales bacterium]